jgi:2-hydroxychromene-2-carboxylate isomerase
MTLHADLFWSFRSPYSYIATPRLRALTEGYDVAIAVRPVYPIAVRIDGFFKSLDPLWIPYLMRDSYREARRAGLMIRWPRPDPIVMTAATGEVARQQPYIARLTRLGVLAAEQGKGLAFIDEVSRTLWSGGVDGWHEGPHLAQAAARAGLDLPALDTQAGAEAARLEAVIAANQTAQRAAGHWGVPLIVFNDEPFFGQDRIDTLLWRMREAGLTARPGPALRPEPLIGVWRLERWEARFEDGEVAFPMGEDAIGRIIYEAHGVMSAMLQRTSGEAGPAGRFVAYSGAWRVKAGEVHHEVSFASRQDWIGATLRRSARWSDDGALHLETPPEITPSGRMYRQILTWRRDR